MLYVKNKLIIMLTLKASMYHWRMMHTHRTQNILYNICTTSTHCLLGWSNIVQMLGKYRDLWIVQIARVDRNYIIVCNNMDL